jgi:3-methylcrotonyl-CoA carboxylase alpha subunit
MIRPVKKLLIANRGEIARRIAFTAKKLGIATVAVAEGQSPQEYLLGLVDEFIPMATPTASIYLDQDFWLDEARRLGCDGIHPGFGFLSENYGFAERVITAGLLWIGPHAAAIKAMASKGEARALAEKTGITVILGIEGIDSQDKNMKRVRDFAEGCGYPVLIKAALGGGGKGMRIVRSQDELTESVQRASSEALNAFGDASLVCEQYLQNPRHLEVQILADKHNHVIALGDRDCSLQRRHQKVIEEAPAPELPPAVRTALKDQACLLASAVSYDSAGTVEFLYDTASEEIYFLEMNTRLQVEHTVTEEVFALDLVEHQLRVAMGQPLDESLRDRKCLGHAIEMRIYCEDVRNSFLPSPGPCIEFRCPQGPGIRYEQGLAAVDEVTLGFDPMVGKLVVRSETRQGAIDLALLSLGQLFFAGPKTNVDLLYCVLKDSTFRKAPLGTSYLDSDTDYQKWCAKYFEEFSEEADDVFSALEAYQFHGASLNEKNASSLKRVTQRSFYEFTPVDSSELKPAIRFIFQRHWHSPKFPRARIQSGMGIFRENLFHYAKLAGPEQTAVWVAISGRHYHRLSVGAEGEMPQGEDSAIGSIIAPVPGKIIAIVKSRGDVVALGEVVFVLESMKMEFEVKAQQSGIIDEIMVEPQSQVAAQEELARFAHVDKEH